MNLTMNPFEKTLQNLLKSASIPAATLETNLILQKVTGRSKKERLLKDEPLNEMQKSQCLALVKKRMQGYPIQYLLGEWEFYGLSFYVGEGVLIPRPETEELVTHAINIVKDKIYNVLDLCSGSGCIAITLAKYCKNAKITAIEKSDSAVSYLYKNCLLHQAKIKIFQQDILSKTVSEQFSKTDLIVCNPPYLASKELQTIQKEVTYEPKEALDGGQNGLRYYQSIIPLWKTRRFLFEIAPWQAEDIVKLLKTHHFSQIYVYKDINHKKRVIDAIK